MAMFILAHLKIIKDTAMALIIIMQLEKSTRESGKLIYGMGKVLILWLRGRSK